MISTTFLPVKRSNFKLEINNKLRECSFYIKFCLRTSQEKYGKSFEVSSGLLFFICHFLVCTLIYKRVSIIFKHLVKIYLIVVPPKAKKDSTLIGRLQSGKIQFHFLLPGLQMNQLLWGSENRIPEIHIHL